MKFRFKVILIAVGIVHALLLYLTLTRRLDFLFNDASHRMGPASDFFAMYFAGKYWTTSEGVYGHGPGFGFRYLPFTAMSIFAWMSELKPLTAFYVWLGLIESALITSIFILKRLIPAPLPFVVACAIAALFSPLYLDFFMGNSNAITACLILIAYYLERTDRRSGALTLFIVACLVKPFALLLLPIIGLKHGSKPVIVTVLILIGFSIPYFSQQAADLKLFVLENFSDKTSSPGFLIHAGNQGFTALIMRIGAASESISLYTLSSFGSLPGWCALAVYAWFALLISLTAWVTWLQRKGPDIALLVFLYLATYVLVYKDVWEHSYALFICGLPMLYLSRIISIRTLLIGAVLLALPTALAFYDLSFYDLRLHDPDWYWSVPVSVLHHATKPAGLLLLYVAAIRNALKVSLAPGRKAPLCHSPEPDPVSSM